MSSFPVCGGPVLKPVSLVSGEWRGPEGIFIAYCLSLLQNNPYNIEADLRLTSSVILYNEWQMTFCTIVIPAAFESTVDRTQTAVTVCAPFLLALLIFLGMFVT